MQIKTKTSTFQLKKRIFNYLNYKQCLLMNKHDARTLPWAILENQN